MDPTPPGVLTQGITVTMPANVASTASSNPITFTMPAGAVSPPRKLDEPPAPAGVTANITPPKPVMSGKAAKKKPKPEGAEILTDGS